MGRPKEFDDDAALALATACFWERGYEATSIRDLSDRMGISLASLYNSFGDKRTVFRKALGHYVAHSFADRVRRFEGHYPPRAAIAAFFDEIIERSLADRDRKGCMLVNTALEIAPHDPEFRKIVAEVLNQIESFFRRCVEAGQRDGTITTAQSAEDLGRLLLCVLLGIRVLARTRPERALLEGLMRPAVALLDGGAADGAAV